MTLDFSPSLSSTHSQALTPGPIDRVSFFAEQKRNRQATWRLVAACTLAIVVMGIPLSIVLTPFAFAFALVVAYTLKLFFIPTALQSLMSVMVWVGAVLDYFINGSGPQFSLSALFLA